MILKLVIDRVYTESITIQVWNTIDFYTKLSYLFGYIALDFFREFMMEQLSDGLQRDTNVKRIQKIFWEAYWI